MQPPCPHCDQPDMSLLRLVLIGEILRAEEPGLVWLADVMQQSGLWHLAEEPLTPPRWPVSLALTCLFASDKLPLICYIGASTT